MSVGQQTILCVSDIMSVNGPMGRVCVSQPTTAERCNAIADNVFAALSGQEEVVLPKRGYLNHERCSKNSFVLLFNRPSYGRCGQAWPGDCTFVEPAIVVLPPAHARMIYDA